MSFSEITIHHAYHDFLPKAKWFGGIEGILNCKEVVGIFQCDTPKGEMMNLSFLTARFYSSHICVYQNQKNVMIIGDKNSIAYIIWSFKRVSDYFLDKYRKNSNINLIIEMIRILIFDRNLFHTFQSDFEFNKKIMYTGWNNRIIIDKSVDDIFRVHITKKWKSWYYLLFNVKYK